MDMTQLPQPGQFPEGTLFYDVEGSPHFLVRDTGVFSAWKGNVKKIDPEGNYWPDLSDRISEEQFWQLVEESKRQE